STSCGHFAFNVYGLGNVSSFAYCNRKILPTTLHKPRGRDPFFSRGKYDVCPRWFAQHCKLIMGPASDGGAGRDKDDRKAHQNAPHRPRKNSQREKKSKQIAGPLPSPSHNNVTDPASAVKTELHASTRPDEVRINRHAVFIEKVHPFAEHIGYRPGVWRGLHHDWRGWLDGD